jgi:hypothetical protein
VSPSAPALAARHILPPTPLLAKGKGGMQSLLLSLDDYRFRVTPSAGSVPKLAAQKPDSVKIWSKFTADRNSFPRIDQIEELQGARCGPLARWVKATPTTHLLWPGTFAPKPLPLAHLCVCQGPPPHPPRGEGMPRFFVFAPLARSTLFTDAKAH